MVDGARFLISYQRLAFLSILSQRHPIQNAAPSTILWRQCKKLDALSTHISLVNEMLFDHVCMVEIIDIH